MPTNPALSNWRDGIIFVVEHVTGVALSRAAGVAGLCHEAGQHAVEGDVIEPALAAPGTQTSSLPAALYLRKAAARCRLSQCARWQYIAYSCINCYRWTFRKLTLAQQDQADDLAECFIISGACVNLPVDEKEWQTWNANLCALLRRFLDPFNCCRTIEVSREPGLVQLELSRPGRYPTLERILPADRPIRLAFQTADRAFPRIYPDRQRLLQRARPIRLCRKWLCKDNNGRRCAHHPGRFSNRFL